MKLMYEDIKHIKTLDSGIMQRKRCLSCGFVINDETLHDSNICKDYEDLMIYEDEHTYIMKT